MKTQQFSIIAILLIVLISIVSFYFILGLDKLSSTPEDNQYLATIATLITAIATLSTIAILFWQTRNSEKSSRAEFTLRLHDSFYYNSKNAKIIRAIDKGKPILLSGGGKFENVDLDDYLGIIELIQIYLDDGVVSYNTIKEMFGFFIVKTWNNFEVCEYIEGVRTKQNDRSYYAAVESLAVRFS